MKITCTRRDDILKRKSEYEAQMNIRKQKYDEQYKAFRNEVQDVYDSVTAQVTEKLAGIPLDFEVDTKSGFREHEIVVRILVNQNAKFSESSALSWDYKVALMKDGTVEKETSSWSGLKACTAEQMDSLKATVRALDIINSMDWANILDVAVPHYRDYVTETDPTYDPDKPDFDRELIEDTIESVIGTDFALLGSASDKSRRWVSGANCYYFVMSQTSKFYKVVDVLKMYVDNPPEGMTAADVIEKTKRFTYNITKDKFIQLLNKPVEPIDMSEYTEVK